MLGYIETEPIVEEAQKAPENAEVDKHCIVAESSQSRADVVDVALGTQVYIAARKDLKC
jgi:hypothetical protein